MKQMNEKKAEAIREIIEGMDTADIVELHNRYCEARNSYEDIVYRMEEFDEVYNDATPMEIAWDIMDTDFDVGEDYFYRSVYGVESFDEWDDSDSPIEIVDIVDFIVGIGDDLGNAKIREALNELDDAGSEDEDEEAV